MNPARIAEPLAGGKDIGLAAAIDQVGYAVVMTDPCGNILYVNAAFTRMTGYSSEEAIGRKPSLLKSGRQDPAYYKDLWTTISAGHNWQGELINRRKDGSQYVEEMTIAPVVDAGGNIVQYIALKKDVTEARRSAEAQQFLAAIVESSCDGILSATLEGTISSWNAGAEAIYGYAAEEVLGKPVSMLWPADGWGEAQRVVHAIEGGQTPSEFETVRKRKDGRAMEVSLTISAKWKSRLRYRPSGMPREESSARRPSYGTSASARKPKRRYEKTTPVTALFLKLLATPRWLPMPILGCCWTPTPRQSLY